LHLFLHSLWTCIFLISISVLFSLPLCHILLL
jgi:hypothetical protein